MEYGDDKIIVTDQESKLKLNLDGQQLLVISDNLKVTYYGDSEDIIDIEHNTKDKNNPKLNLQIKFPRVGNM